MTDEEPQITLVDVDEGVLEQLVDAAVNDAAADEVTPPLTAGTAWTPTRIVWLRNYHHDRRAGLDGPAAESTWAVMVNDTVVGAVRLKRTELVSQVETGIWLTRNGRGRGVGRLAMAAVLLKAKAAKATSVVAETRSGNVAAISLLRAFHFELTLPDDHGSVRAYLNFIAS